MSSSTIRSIPDARFSCASCSRCCRLWSVTVDEHKVRQLRAHDWSHIGPGDPFVRNRGPGDPYRTRMVNGHCFFLDNNNLCRIHTELGYDAKPDGCKAFPLRFTDIQDQTYARLSFYCPTVVANNGKKLRHQMRWVRAAHKAARDAPRSAPLALTDALELTVRELDSIETQLLHWLEQHEHSMADRLAACARLLSCIDARAAREGKSAIATCLQDAQRRGLTEVAAEGRQGGIASQAGPVLSLFLASDCKPTKLARMGHFFGVRLFNLGLCGLRSYTIRSKASKRAIRRVRFAPTGSDDGLLTRYFVQKIKGRRHLHGNVSLVAGFNLYVVAFGVVHILARVMAAADDRTETDAADVAAAVSAADLIVLEHAAITEKPAFAALIHTILGRPTLCASMLVRLEAGSHDQPSAPDAESAVS